MTLWAMYRYGKLLYAVEFPQPCEWMDEKDGLMVRLSFPCILGNLIHTIGLVYLRETNMIVDVLGMATIVLVICALCLLDLYFDTDGPTS
jgi:hypothetical protein